MLIRTAYSEKERVHPALDPETMTKQAMKDECDINNILKKYRNTGLLTHVRQGGSYENLPSDIDFHNAMNVMLEAQDSFEALPSRVRREFGNNPESFLNFVADPKNRDRMREMGLLSQDAIASNNNDVDRATANQSVAAPVTDPETATQGAVE